MNYTLHQLQIFLEVVKQKSITRAAEEMHMTQPALSIQLKNFQFQFDIPLTEIIGKKLYVTDFGESVAATARNILNEAEAIKYKTKEYSSLLAGKLRISSASTGKYVIPYFLSPFIKQFPGIDLMLDVTNRATVIADLKENEIDFGLVSVLPDNLSVYEELLLENKLFMVGNTSEFKKNQPLIYREEGSATRVAMDNYFSRRTEHKKLQLTTDEAIKQAVIAGLGYSVISLVGAKNELFNKELYIVKVKGLPIITHWRLIWLKDKKLSPIAANFLKFLKENKEGIIRRSFQWYREF